MNCFQSTITSLLGRLREVFTVEMAQELAKHCQNEDARYDRLIRKGFWIFWFKWPQSQTQHRK